MVVAQYQSQVVDATIPKRNEADFRIAFYNVENLFDTFDDPAIRDDEFTPEGEKAWSYYRYKQKLNKLAKVIIAIGEWSPPEIVGLCEIENFQVLLDLISETPLKSYKYQIIHQNSRDDRGIDVALIYRSDRTAVFKHRYISVTDDSWRTRDILHASLQVFEKDTINLFVNHWPSRYGGKEQTEYKRISVAEKLRSYLDSISANSNMKIVVMGDFNDEPADKSILEVLGAKRITKITDAKELYNISSLGTHSSIGTIVYSEIDPVWYLFDQFMVSGSLLINDNVKIRNNKAYIFSADWLISRDKPFRTYQGPIYKGGFSDHLPIFIDLQLK